MNLLNILLCVIPLCTVALLLPAPMGCVYPMVALETRGKKCYDSKGIKETTVIETRGSLHD